MDFVAADETCVGTQREDGSYDFDLPDAVTMNVQDDACDAEWTIDVNIKTYLSCQAILKFIFIFNREIKCLDLGHNDRKAFRSLLILL